MIQDKVAQLLLPILEDMGYVLWGCEYIAQGAHSLLRIYIDKEAGIGIEDCEQVSHRVSAMLDVEDPISGQYRLEVSSPGFPRALFYSWQYRKYLGYEVRIVLCSPMDGKRKFIGTIVSADDDKLVLSIAEVQHEFLFSNIAKANLTVE